LGDGGGDLSSARNVLPAPCRVVAPADHRQPQDDGARTAEHVRARRDDRGHLHVPASRRPSAEAGFGSSPPTGRRGAPADGCSEPAMNRHVLCLAWCAAVFLGQVACSEPSAAPPGAGVTSPPGQTSPVSAIQVPRPTTPPAQRLASAPTSATPELLAPPAPKY